MEMGAHMNTLYLMKRKVNKSLLVLWYLSNEKE